MNPTEHYLHLISQDFGDNTAEEITALCDAWDAGCSRDACRARGGCVESLDALVTVAELEERSEAAPCDLSGDVPVAWALLRQLYFLSKRTLFNNVLNPAIFIVRLVMYVMLSLMVGTMYLNDDDITSTLVLLFFVQGFLVFMSVSILPFFEELKTVFIRERANGQVSAAPFVIANLSCSLPMLFLIALLSTVIIVPCGGLNGPVMFCLNLFLSLVVAESMMHVIGALQPHFVIGLALGAGIFGMFMLCEGFMVPRDRIPGWWIWAHYLGFHTYAFQAFVFNEFKNHPVGSPEYALLETYDIPQDLNQGANMGILVAYAVGFETIFGLVLQFLHTGRR